MNEEAQRVAIAEACGAKWSLDRFGNRILGGVSDELIAVDAGFLCLINCPDFLNDLNAMHEAEKTLDPYVRNDFIAHLWSVTGNMPSANFWTEYNFRGLYACTHATAAQRAEAFLRTIGKWEDGK